MSEYDTKYSGRPSDFFEKIKITGAARTDQGTEAYVNAWKSQIYKIVTEELERRKLINEQNDFLIPQAEGDECNLYMVFWLLDKTKKWRDIHGNKQERNRYNDIDVDNLYKAARDAIADTPLLKDDSYVKGIKAYKEFVTQGKRERLVFQCITTKTFTIDEVISIKGNDLMPGYWKHEMQCITATDTDGKTGKFIDNKWKHLFIVPNDDKIFPDAVPGYNWGARKKGDKVRGCMVFEREHINKSEGELKGDKKTFHWLHKWAWW